MNSNIENIQMSQLRSFSDHVKQIQDVLDFTIGDSNEHAPEKVTQATILSLQQHETHYGSTQGFEALRQKIAVKQKRHLQEVHITSGATQGLFEVMMGCLNHHEGVLTSLPTYPGYINTAKALGLEIQYFRMNEDYQISKELLEKSIQKNTKALLINHPHNPSGTLLNQTSIQIIHEIVRKYHLLLIWDAVYMECGQYLTLYKEELRDTIVQIHSFSKNMQMSGFRIGYVCADEKIVREIMKIHQIIQVSLPLFIQKAALVALDCEGICFDSQKKYILHRLKEMGIDAIENEGPYYVLFGIHQYKMSSEMFAKRLLDEFHVALLPGEYFRYEGYIRMSCCVEIEKCKRGCDCLEAFVKNL